MFVSQLTETQKLRKNICDYILLFEFPGNHSFIFELELYHIFRLDVSECLIRVNDTAAKFRNPIIKNSWYDRTPNRFIALCSPLYSFIATALFWLNSRPTLLTVWHFWRPRTFATDNEDHKTNICFKSKFKFLKKNLATLNSFCTRTQAKQDRWAQNAFVTIAFNLYLRLRKDLNGSTWYFSVTGMLYRAVW